VKAGICHPPQAAPDHEVPPVWRDRMLSRHA
jgi:hypothetical protein